MMFCGSGKCGAIRVGMLTISWRFLDYGKYGKKLSIDFECAQRTE